MTDSVPSTDRKKWVVFLIVAALSLVADQATKIWARDALPVVRADRSTTPCIFAKAAAPDEANAPSSPTVSFCRSMTRRTVVRGSSLTR